MSEDCAVWNVPKASASVRDITISSIPTLVMSGSFDGKTSPQWGFYVAGPLENSTSVVIPGGGHGALILYGLPDDSPAKPCAMSVVASFLANPIAPDTTCVNSLTTYPFTTSASALSPDQLSSELDNLSLIESHY